MYTAFESSVNKVITMFYLILWIFTGNFVLLNLILAILLEGFSLGDDDNDTDLIDELK